ncbi:MAG: pyridoxamine 5'-phosphate oxidase family protein, partial [Ruminococcus sp.]|nr:pyridoxamine 5'-phosphate oxidase family protein [Ruminococcus sp.]
GYKVGLIRKDNRASFEMDCKHELQYFEDKGYCTMAYESLIGRGHIRILSEEEKLPALKLLMAHYHNGKDMPFSTAAIQRTIVYALKVESVTGKRKAVK